MICKARSLEYASQSSWSKGSCTKRTAQKTGREMSSYQVVWSQESYIRGKTQLSIALEIQKNSRQVAEFPILFFWRNSCQNKSCKKCKSSICWKLGKLWEALEVSPAKFLDGHEGIGWKPCLGLEAISGVIFARLCTKKLIHHCTEYCTAQTYVWVRYGIFTVLQ